MNLNIHNRYSLNLSRSILVSSSIFGIVMWGVQPAYALQCNGQYQVIRGEGEISTPFCEDNYLAAIARIYGWKVNNKTVRDNPVVKARICRHIGHDSRLTGICDETGEGTDNSSGDIGTPQ